MSEGKRPEWLEVWAEFPGHDAADMGPAVLKRITARYCLALEAAIVAAHRSLLDYRSLDAVNVLAPLVEHIPAPQKESR